MGSSNKAFGRHTVYATKGAFINRHLRKQILGEAEVLQQAAYVDKPTDRKLGGQSRQRADRNLCLEAHALAGCLRRVP